MLDLSFNELNSSIPASIGDLTRLSYLNLSNNQLSGSIPSSIGNILKDGNLLLRQNQLSGSIPSSIGNIPYFELDSNYFVFDGMEEIVQGHFRSTYSPQAKSIFMQMAGFCLSMPEAH